jgi:hypothetical protein
MSVPFNLEVALAAIKLMTNPTCDKYDTKIIYEQLVAQIKNQHPMLISEHIDYVDGLIKYAKKMLTQANAGQITEQQAFEKFTSSYKDFPVNSLKRVFAYCKQQVG